MKLLLVVDMSSTHTRRESHGEQHEHVEHLHLQELQLQSLHLQKGSVRLQQARVKVSKGPAMIATFVVRMWGIVSRWFRPPQSELRYLARAMRASE